MCPHAPCEWSNSPKFLMFPRPSIEIYSSFKKGRNSNSTHQMELPTIEVKTQPLHPNQLHIAADRSPQISVPTVHSPPEPPNDQSLQHERPHMTSAHHICQPPPWTSRHWPPCLRCGCAILGHCPVSFLKFSPPGPAGLALSSSMTRLGSLHREDSDCCHLARSPIGQQCFFLHWSLTGSACDHALSLTWEHQLPTETPIPRMLLETHKHSEVHADFMSLGMKNKSVKII